MTANYVDIYRHFGADAEKVLLGRLGLSCRNEYFFEYDQQYLVSFPNPSPALLEFSQGLQQEKYGKFPHFLADSLPDDWGQKLMNIGFRKKGFSINEISYIDRLRNLSDDAKGSLSFSPKELGEISGRCLGIEEIEELNQNALTVYEEETCKVLETLSRISCPCGGSDRKSVV